MSKYFEIMEMNVKKLRTYHLLVDNKVQNVWAVEKF